MGRLYGSSQTGPACSKRTPQPCNPVSSQRLHTQSSRSRLASRTRTSRSAPYSRQQSFRASSRTRPYTPTNKKTTKLEPKASRQRREGTRMNIFNILSNNTNTNENISTQENFTFPSVLPSCQCRPCHSNPCSHPRAGRRTQAQAVRST